MSVGLGLPGALKELKLKEREKMKKTENEGISMDNSLPHEKQCCGNCGQVLRNRVCEAPLGPRGRGWCSYWYKG